jgi:hypothetical protein
MLRAETRVAARPARRVALLVLAAVTGAGDGACSKYG